jgi:simple sugar transport system ATP-binding protein
MQVDHDPDTMTGIDHDPHAAVEMIDITKRFGRVVANDTVSLDVRFGEIHALLGENGAGKTTLMNILSGFLHPDSGSILVRGRDVKIRTPIDAFELGIGMVHQHSALVPTLTVAENMLLGDRRIPKGFLVRRDTIDELSASLAAAAERHGLEVSPDAFVWQLSVGERQRVEILRALYREATILILDEPTASLTPPEVAPLLYKLRGMAAGGAAVVLITHHLDEVMACADRITVLRAGRRVATTTPRETTTRELAREMVGRDVQLMAVLTGEEETMATAGEVVAVDPVLSAIGLVADGSRGVTALVDASFEVRRGEIVAIAGVEGNGQTELEEVLFGLRSPKEGTVLLDGEDVTSAKPAALMARGVGYVPSDRYRRGLVPMLSIADNLVLDRIDRPPFRGRFSIRRRQILETARVLIERFGIRPTSPRERAGTLSGGNAQRVVLARALRSELRVLLAAQPTRGLDVGAIGFVWDRLRDERADGVAVLLISTDLDEVFALADRCYVMYRGRLVGPWTRDAFDREEFGLAMGGASDTSGGRGTAAPPGTEDDGGA